MTRSQRPAQLKTLHACIKKVTEDLDGLRFNTAISAHDGFRERRADVGNQTRQCAENFFSSARTRFAPHLAAELWLKLSTLNSQPSTNLAYAPLAQVRSGIADRK